MYYAWITELIQDVKHPNQATVELVRGVVFINYDMIRVYYRLYFNIK